MSNDALRDAVALSTLDFAIIGAFFVFVIFAGLFLSKKAAQGLDDYFLGGRTIPWWVMGASGTASNLDMTGTMVIVAFFYAIGLQGFWVAMRGGIGLPLGILMIYMGMWLARSNVMTTAEWMSLRFGRGSGGKAARILSAVSNLVVTIGFTVYFCKGSGKFLSIFLPWDADTCAMMMVVVGLLYTMAAGLYGVVYTDLIQEVFLIITAVLISVKAFTLDNQAELIAGAGENWMKITPNMTAEPMPWLADPGVYHLFGLCIVFWVARGLFEGMGGFTGGYMPQRYYAMQGDREAGLMTAEWIGLLSLRWTMVIGLAVLGLYAASESAEVAAVLAEDPEKTLPIVLGQVLPSGFKGIAVAGLIAAAMSTFDSTINAGASYWVKDIYQEYINPDADQKTLVRQSYVATLGMATIAVVIAFSIKNINEIWSWITGPLSAGLFAPIVLRWYWWRLNGQGFAIATATGLTAAIGFKAGLPEAPLYVSFPATALLSLAGGVVGAYMFEPVDDETADRFFKQIKPFGLWGPVRQRLGLSHPDVIKARLQGKLALVNTPLAVIGHLSIFLIAIHAVLHAWERVAFFSVVFAACSFVLYFTWYKKLPPWAGKGDAEAHSAGTSSGDGPTVAAS